MKCGNAVNLVAGCNAEIRHSDRAAGNYRGALNEIGVMRRVPCVGAETVVYLFDNLINSREKAFYEVFAPFFESLRHDGVVRVCDRRGNKLPSVVPAVAAFVQKNAHKLRNRECRMRVVYLNRRLFGQIFNRAVMVKMMLYYILNGRGNKEILLTQTQTFSLRVIVGGVEHF